MTVARLTAKKLESSQVQVLIESVVSDFSKLEGLKTIVLFGSAVDGEMTNASDIDVVLIFETKETMNAGRLLAPTIRKKATWPMDLLCVDSETFLRKSAIGGVFFVAKNEGRVIYGNMP